MAEDISRTVELNVDAGEYAKALKQIQDLTRQGVELMKQYGAGLKEQERVGKAAAASLGNVEKETKELNAAARASAGEMGRMQRSLEQVRGAANSMRTSMRSALASFSGVAGIRETLEQSKELTSTIKELAKTAEASGVSFDVFQDLSQQLVFAGASADGARQAVLKFGRAVDQARKGNAQMGEFFSGRGLDVNQSVESLWDKVLKQGVSISEAQPLVEEEGAPFLANLSKGYAEAQRAAQAWGNVSEAEAQRAEAAMARLAQAQGAGMALLAGPATAMTDAWASVLETLNSVAPAIEGAMKGVTDVFEGAKSAIEGIRQVVPTDALEGFGRTLGVVGTAVAALGLAGLAAQFVALAAPVIAVVAPLVGIAAACAAGWAAIGTLIAAVLRATGAADTWGEAIQIMIGWLGDLVRWVTDAGAEVLKFFNIIDRAADEKSSRRIKGLTSDLAAAKDQVALLNAEIGGRERPADDAWFGDDLRGLYADLDHFTGEVSRLNGELAAEQARFQKMQDDAARAARAPVPRRRPLDIPARATPEAPALTRIVPSMDDFEKAREAYQDLAREAAQAFNDETASQAAKARTLAEQVFDRRRGGEITPLTLALSDGSFKTICTQVRDMSQQHEDCLRLEMELEAQRDQVGAAAEKAIRDARGTMNENITVPIAPEPAVMAKLIADAIQIAEATRAEADARQAVQKALEAAAPLTAESAQRVESMQAQWERTAAAAERWLAALRESTGLNLPAIGEALGGVGRSVGGFFGQFAGSTGPLAAIRNAFGPKTAGPANADVQNIARAAVAEVLGPNARVEVTSATRLGANDPSGRHRTGNAIDVRVIDASGTLVGANDPRRADLMRAFARHGAQGLGSGPEYMGAPFHVDTVGTRAGGGHVWGSLGQAMAAELVPALQANQRGTAAAMQSMAQNVAASTRVIVQATNPGGATAGIRNFNPGNIIANDNSLRWAGVVGASTNTDNAGKDRQLVFASADAGMQATIRLLMQKWESGRRSTFDLIAAQGGWTPGNTSAAGNIAAGTGVGVNDALDFRDKAQFTRFIQSLMTQEHGAAGASAYTPDMIGRNIDTAGTGAGLLGVAQGAQSAAPAMQGLIQTTEAARAAFAELVPQTQQIAADLTGMRDLAAQTGLSQQQLADAVLGYTNATVQAGSSTAEYRRELAELEAIKQSGLLSQDAYNAKLRELKDGLANVNTSGQSLKQTFAEGVGGTFGDSIAAMINALASGEKPAKAFFKALVQGLASLASGLANQLIQNWLKGLGGGAPAVPGAAPAAGGGGGGGILSGLLGGIGNAFGSIFKGIGGFLGFAKGGAFAGGTGLAHGIHRSPTYFPLNSGGFHKFARGGAVMAERGAEAVVPLSRGRGGKLGIAAHGMGEGGRATANIEVRNYGPPVNATVRDDPERDRAIVELTMKQVEDSIQRGATPISRALEARYNVRRRGI